MSQAIPSGPRSATLEYLRRFQLISDWTGRRIQDVRAFWHELEVDRALLHELERTITQKWRGASSGAMGSSLRGSTFRERLVTRNGFSLGNLELYALVRAAEPKIVIETGVSAGVSSTLILRALERTGIGRLISVDLPNRNQAGYRYPDGTTDAVYIPDGLDSGWIVPEKLRKRWTLLQGKGSEMLAKILLDNPTVDFFFHDSEHTAENVLRELTAVWPAMALGGIVYVDDAFWNSGFVDFSRLHGGEILSTATPASRGLIVKRRLPHAEVGRGPLIDHVRTANREQAVGPMVSRPVEEGKIMESGNDSSQGSTKSSSRPGDSDLLSVSVVIPSWGRATQLRECVRSLRSASFAPREIIVVDCPRGGNYATDALDPGTVRAIRVPKWISIAAARNLGARESDSRFLFFVDSDNIVPIHTISRLVHAMSNDPTIGVLGPVSRYPGTEGRIWSAGARKSRVLRTNLVQKSLPSVLTGPYDTDIIQNAFLVPRDLFETLGGFDELNFSIQEEEAEFQLRCRLEGHRTAIEPGAEIWHDIENNATAHLSPGVLREAFRARIVADRIHDRRRNLGFVSGIAFYIVYYCFLVDWGPRQDRPRVFEILISILSGVFAGLTVPLQPTPGRKQHVG